MNHLIKFIHELNSKLFVNYKSSKKFTSCSILHNIDKEIQVLETVLLLEYSLCLLCDVYWLESPLYALICIGVIKNVRQVLFQIVSLSLKLNLATQE